MAKRARREVHEIDMDEAMADVGVGGGKFLNIKDGIEYEIRVVKPIGNDDHGKPMKAPWLKHVFHSKILGKKFGGFDVEGGQRVKLHCLDFHKGKDCPACRVMEHCEAEGESSGVQTDTRFLMNVVCNGKMQILDAAPSVIKAFQDYLDNKRYGPRIFDPKRGRNFTLLRKLDKDTGFRKYTLTPDPESSEIELEDWEDKAYDLAKEIRIITAEEMTDILVKNLHGLVPVEDALNADYEDDEDEEKEPEEDEEEEEEKPRRRQHKVESKSDESDEDVEEHHRERKAKRTKTRPTAKPARKKAGKKVSKKGKR